ncbi:MAG: DEAD/DEAH box helicase, partial [Candidatus Gracilibacteria bacterium]|nr:DEAD/DEAH box helicase [Candidatus Gracilibacteria bacterium]
MKFTELNLKPEVLSGLAKLGYESPTKIQEEVILEYINGKNIIGQSQTGTGKTAAFIISLLQSIDITRPGVQALIMAPTRELVTQIKDEFAAVSADMIGIRSLSVYGGSPIFKQIDMLRKGQTVVIGTPGRIIDLIERKALKLQEVEYFVLDEVDRMLDMGFVDDIDFIWNSLTAVKQTLAFSATITPEIKSIVEKYLGVNYTFIKATDDLMVEKIDHSFMEVPHLEKYEQLKKFVGKHKSKKTIVFVQTKRDTEVISDKLREDGYKADCLNGDMRQRERFKALKDFQDGISSIFVVTDVAARGLNVKNIDLVVNFDVPSDPESYIHRIGRTGRAGAEGRAIMFVSNSEQMTLKNIERRNKITIKQVDEEGNEVTRRTSRNDGGSFNGGRNRFSSRSSGGSRGGSRGGFGGRSSSSESRFGGERTPSRSGSHFDRPERSDARSDSRSSEGGFGRSEYKPRTSSTGGRFGG